MIGEPQPAIVALEQTGMIRGRVLDAGCGLGEHTILLTALDYDVLGIDFAPNAIDQARANAATKGIDARFGVADAMKLDSEPGRGFGPMVSEAQVREAFADRWELEAVDTTTYRGTVGEMHSAVLGEPVGATLDEPAWLARVRRG